VFDSTYNTQFTVRNTSGWKTLNSNTKIINYEFSLYVILGKFHLKFTLNLSAYAKTGTASTLIVGCCENVKKAVKAVISNNVIRQWAKNLFCDNILRNGNSKKVI
jgi:hypothetical protein